MRRKCALSVNCRAYRISGARKRIEERIALGIDLDAAVCVARGSEKATVVDKHFLVPLAKMLEQLCRALDVGEEQRDGAARKVPHAHQRTTTRATLLAPLRLASGADRGMLLTCGSFLQAR
jgi:hypothetical protein